MKKARNYDDVVRFVSRREEFSHGSCGARSFEIAPLSVGRLDDDERATYRKHADFAERFNLPFYVVYSYSTPVAWAAGNFVYHVDQRFSVTTSKQQNKFRMALTGDSFAR